MWFGLSFTGNVFDSFDCLVSHVERSIFCGLIVVMAMMLIGEWCNVGSLVVDGDYLVVGNGCDVYFLKFGGMK